MNDWKVDDQPSELYGNYTDHSVFRFCHFFLLNAASIAFLTWPLIFVEKLTLKFKGIEIRSPSKIILYPYPNVALYLHKSCLYFLIYFYLKHFFLSEKSGVQFLQH